MLWDTNIPPKLSVFKIKFTEDNFSIPNIYPSLYRPQKIARLEDRHNLRPV